MEPGFIVFVFIGCAMCGGLGGITMELRRIAKALEEKNKLQNRPTQP
jgi:hypothetical protein